jgi:DNA-directed RNA polymerase subunit M/transcription elongation factor TFIIS
MALPKLDNTTYTLTVPSTNAKVKFRPFVVREQKALLIAQQSENSEVMIDTLKSVIAACIITDKFNVDELATFDLEYMFLQIRAKSAGEIVELLFTCDECETQTKMSFDLTKLKVEFPTGHATNIKLTNEVGVIMKYPDINLLKTIESMNANDVEAIFDIVIDCISCIYDQDQMHYAKDQTSEELNEFVNSLTAAQFAKIQNFFETMPRLQQIVKFDCPKCKHHHDKVLTGLSSFF